jgi:hypothetical protein
MAKFFDHFLELLVLKLDKGHKDLLADAKRLLGKVV